MRAIALARATTHAGRVAPREAAAGAALVPMAGPGASRAAVGGVVSPSGRYIAQPRVPRMCAKRVGGVCFRPQTAAHCTRAASFFSARWPEPQRRDWTAGAGNRSSLCSATLSPSRRLAPAPSSSDIEVHVATWDPELTMPPRELVAWAFEALSAEDRRDIFSSLAVREGAGADGTDRDDGGVEDRALLAVALASPVTGLRVASRGFCRRVLARAIEARRSGAEGAGGAGGWGATSGGLAVPPPDLRLAVAAGGKPFLAGVDRGSRLGEGSIAPRLYFNASNTAGAVGVALHWADERGKREILLGDAEGKGGEEGARWRDATAGGEVGFDLERWRRMEGGTRPGGEAIERSLTPAGGAGGELGGGREVSMPPLPSLDSVSDLAASPRNSSEDASSPIASWLVASAESTSSSAASSPAAPSSPLRSPSPPSPRVDPSRRLLRLAQRWFSAAEVRALETCIADHSANVGSSATSRVNIPKGEPLGPPVLLAHDAGDRPTSCCPSEFSLARPSGFFSALWTLKESYVKCVGRGIARGPGTKGFSVLFADRSRGDGEGEPEIAVSPSPRILVSLSPPPEDADRCFVLWLFRLRDHHLAGLCWDGGKRDGRGGALNASPPNVHVHLYDPHTPWHDPASARGVGEGDGTRGAETSNGDCRDEPGYKSRWGELVGTGGNSRE